MIRLAHYQGLLSQKNLNVWQWFAAGYWLRMNRRIELRDVEDSLQRQTWYLNPERYDQLWLMGEIRPDITAEDDEAFREEAVTDIDEMDRYFANLDEKRVLTGAQLFDVIDDKEGWI